MFIIQPRLAISLFIFLVSLVVFVVAALKRGGAEGIEHSGVGASHGHHKHHVSNTGNLLRLIAGSHRRNRGNKYGAAIRAGAHLVHTIFGNGSKKPTNSHPKSGYKHSHRHSSVQHQHQHHSSHKKSGK
ncbi:unnamed protein product [Caenorhabditis angaria]|uniref:Uncharacterized protein n=1 Tax=Caenorhabditis angaria TaxID=860376 RepID=A0A9P1IHR1_9PELO|nr:unnamed protein product [Caenorhabditis angaria]